MGAIIAPPVPAFYAMPDTIDAMVDHTLGRVLDCLDIESGKVSRWGEDVGNKGRMKRSRNDKS
jgi:4-hydroxy-3-polyprenylbenzoate decarboxylase